MKISQKSEIELLDKLRGIGFLDSRAVSNELSRFETVTEKLDYLKDLKEKYGNKYNTIINSLEPNEKDYCLKKITSINEIVSNKVVSSLEIPESIFEEHFKDGLNNPEFTFWFLKFNAHSFFKALKNEDDFILGLESPKRDLFIKGRLKEINDFEKKADELVLNKKINTKDIFRNTEKMKYRNEIELLRIKTDYYITNPFQYVQGVNETIWLYAEHIYFKEYLNEIKQEEVKTKTKDKPTQIQRALYTHYLQKTKSIDYFDFKEGGKVSAIKKYVKENEFGSWKSFQLMYNSISQDENKRICISNIDNINFVIKHMLNEFPKAKTLALDELKLAEIKA